MDINNHKALLDQIKILVNEVPYELVMSVVDAISKINDNNHIIASIPQPHFRTQVVTLLDIWKSESPEMSHESIAFAILASAQTVEQQRWDESISLVWTGPKSQTIPMRRTDQALLQVINEAEKRLLIVSFAVYKIEQICQALVQAAERGVDIRICIETPDINEGENAYNTLQALGQAVAQRSTIYYWPLTKRQCNIQGHYGILHVKCAVADEKLLFLSSANLTEYAFTVNMELGVLIRAGNLPSDVVEHFDSLIEEEILVLLS